MSGPPNQPNAEDGRPSTPTPTTHGSRGRSVETWVVFGLGVAALVIFLITIWELPLVLSNDGPQAVLLAHADAHYADPGSIFRQQFERGLGLAGRGFALLYTPFAAILSPGPALKVAQALIVTLLALGAGAVAVARDRRFGFGALMGSTLAFAWPVYMGFYAYCVSTAVGLFLLAYVLRYREPTRLQRLIVLFSLLFQVLLHPFAQVVTLTAILLVWASRLWARGAASLRIEIPWMVGFATPTAVVLALLSFDRSELAHVYASGGTEWFSLSELLATLPRVVAPGSGMLGWTLLVLAAASLTIGARRAFRAGSPDDRALAVAAAGLLALGLFGPSNVSGWQFFAPRFLCVGIVLCLSLAPSPSTPTQRSLLAVLAGVLAVALALNARATQRSLSAACADAIAGLERVVPRSGMQLPILFDRICGLPEDPADAPIPFLHPAMHLHALFAVRHGGSVPYVFNGPKHLHFLSSRLPQLAPVPPLNYLSLDRDAGPMRDPDKRRNLLDMFAVYGMRYENVLLFGGTEADKAQLAERGYVTDFTEGSFVNAHASGCHLQVVVEAREGDGPLMAVAGLGDEPIWSAQFSQRDNQVSASFITLCGDIWASLRWEGQGTRCKNEDGRGRLLAKSKSATPTVIRCER